MLFTLKTTLRDGHYYMHCPDEENEGERNSDSSRNHTTDQQPSQGANMSLILKSTFFPVDRNWRTMTHRPNPPATCFENKVVLELSTLFAYILSVVTFPGRAAWNSGNRPHGPQSLKSFLSVPLQRTFADPALNKKQNKKRNDPSSIPKRGPQNHLQEMARALRNAGFQAPTCLPG